MRYGETDPIPYALFYMVNCAKICLVIAVAIGISPLFAGDLCELDRSVYDAVHDGWKCGFSDGYFPNVTHLGDAEFYLTLNLGMVCFGDEKMRDTGKLAVVGLATTMLTTELIKLAIGRARPENQDSPRWDSSLPSGHATAAFAMAYIYGEQYHHLRIPLYLLAASVGISRIYTGMHYPSDVIAGAAVGTLGGIVVMKNKQFVLKIGF